MTSVLADLALESEAATALAMRLAGAADRAARGDAAEAAAAAADAARGQVLDLQADAGRHRRGAGVPGRQRLRRGVGLPRLYRDAPLNSIWEGSGNVTALDVLRALTRSPAAPTPSGPSWPWRRRRQRLDQAATRGSGASWTRLAGDRPPRRSRRAGWPGWSTVTLQAALLVRHAPAAVSDAFCASRLGPRADSLRPRGLVRHAAAGLARSPAGPDEAVLQIGSADARVAWNCLPARCVWDGSGTNFAIFSEVAELVELCLFADDAAPRRGSP